MVLPYDWSLSKDGTYVFHCEASVELLQLKEDDPSMLLVELDQTIFHPQGGGARQMALKSGGRPPVLPFQWGNGENSLELGYNSDKAIWKLQKYIVLEI